MADLVGAQLGMVELRERERERERERKRRERDGRARWRRAAATDGQRRVAVPKQRCGDMRERDGGEGERDAQPWRGGGGGRRAATGGGSSKVAVDGNKKRDKRKWNQDNTKEMEE